MNKIKGMLIVEVTVTPEFIGWLETFLESVQMPIPGNASTVSDKVGMDWLFLIPAQGGAASCIQFIKSHYQQIFVSILMTYSSDKTCWPKDMSWEQFEKYFIYAFHSTIYDFSE